MAIDGNDWIAASVLGNGFYKTQSIRMQKQFGDKIEKGAMFITDSESLDNKRIHYKKARRIVEDDDNFV